MFGVCPFLCFESHPQSMLRPRVILVAILIVATLVSAQWNMLLTVASGSSFHQYGISKGIAGTMYAFGWFNGPTLSVHHGNGSLAFTVANQDTAANTPAGYLIAYDVSGAALWSLQMSGNGHEQFEWAAQSAQGNLYAMIDYMEASPSTISLYNRAGAISYTFPAWVHGYGRLLVRFDTAGNVTWIVRALGYGGKENDHSGTLSIDASERLFVSAGSGYANTVYYNISGALMKTYTITNTWDGVVFAYTGDGVYLWDAYVGNAGYEITHSGTIDPVTGDFIAVGWYQAPSISITGPSNTVSLTSNSNAYLYAFLARFSSTGAVKWAISFTGTAEVRLWSVTSDSVGNTIGVGVLAGQANVLHANATSFRTLTTSGGRDCWIVSVSSGGSINWATRIAGTMDEFGAAVAIDSTNSIYVMGHSFSTSINILHANDTVAQTLTPPSSGTNFIVKYSSGGVAQWAVYHSNCTRNINSYGLTIDADNNIYATSTYNTTAGLYSTNGTLLRSLPTVTKLTSYVVRYSSNGQLAVSCPLGQVPIAGVCTACPHGRFCPLGTQSTITCGLNSNTTATGASSISQCLCNAGHFGTNGTCSICNQGKFCPVGSTSETSCGPNSNTTSTRASSDAQCLCNAGYFGSNGTCQICNIGKFCPAGSTVETSCGLNTYTASTESSMQSQCLCDAGYFGSNGSCAICSQGKFCPAGATTETACGLNSNTATTGASLIAQCECNAGFYGTNGACTECPQGTFCPSGTQQPILCPTNETTTMNGTTAASGCICNAGFERKNGACRLCPIGSFCPLSSPPIPCGDGKTTQSQGARSLSDCFRVVSTVITKTIPISAPTPESSTPVKEGVEVTMYFYAGFGMLAMTALVQLLTFLLYLRQRAWQRSLPGQQRSFGPDFSVSPPGMRPSMSPQAGPMSLHRSPMAPRQQ